MRIGKREFDTEQHTYVMGILNVTPDSFSDGGKYENVDEALKRTEEMIAQGMDILDVGGESTRPGYTMISDEEEARRVMPVIEAVKARFDIPVSLDTCKSRVAQWGIQAGADLINDIWGLKYDRQMAAVIAGAQLPCLLMHNRRSAVYGELLEEVKADLAESLEIAQKAGIHRDRIILDPGIGFAKNPEQNLKIIQNLEQLKELGCPVLLAASRKSVIGLTLALPAAERLEGTLVTTVFGVLKGCAFVRVHDIRENLRAIKMTEAILKVGQKDGSDSH